jgi:hypothetical protein
VPGLKLRYSHPLPNSPPVTPKTVKHPTTILLAFADALAGQKTKLQIWLVWTDLEEAVKAFDNDDGLYGSRHLARKLAANGTASRVTGFFLLDMIGDKDLGVARETGSTRWLQDFIAQAARELGYGRYFFQYEAYHRRPRSIPGIRHSGSGCCGRHVRRMGPEFDSMGEFHHGNADTMDKISRHSLEVVGRTMLRTVELLDKQTQ